MPLTNNLLLQNGTDYVTGVTPSQVDVKNGRSPGLPNPYGPGASAFEPNTQIYDPSNDPLMRGSETQLTGQSEADKTAADALFKASKDGPAITGAPSTPGLTGSALAFVNAAKTMLGKPYVWGGTTSAGVDCSGLLYYAFNAAGIKMPRYVASQYGKMGTQVTAEQAHAGDIVYWDEPGSVDHVGIYLGNGMVLNSPHTGTTTQINHVWGNPVYRRIINDGNFGLQATPAGPPVQSYAGQVASSLFGTYTPSGIGIDPTVQLSVNPAPHVHEVI